MRAGAGQHDAGPVVAVEDQRPLDGAGRQHDLLRPHPPQALARLVGRRQRQVVGDALEQGQIVVVEIAEGGGAAQDGDLGQRLELGHGSLQPGIVGAPVEVGERAALAQQRAAELGLALGQDHPRAAAAGGQRRHQARPARAPTTSTSQWAWRCR